MYWRHMFVGTNFILCSDILKNVQLKYLNLINSEMNCEFILQTFIEVAFSLLED